jgi:hypothetical protein
LKKSNEKEIVDEKDDVEELDNDDCDSVFDCEDRDDSEDYNEKLVDDDVSVNGDDNEHGSSSTKKVNFRTDFFEQEAELSGSEEGDSDENYDAESEDDNIVCSGDEDEMPSDTELKDQLGQIYL